MSKVVKKSYANNKEILKVLQDYYAIPVMVSDTGITADGNGKKIVKAGSLLNKGGEIKNDGTVRYVLLSDVDVTYGPKEGAGLYKAVVDTTKIPTQPSKDAINALKGIFFVKEDNDYLVGGTA